MTLSPLPPVGSELTSPLARLLFAIAEAGILGPKPGLFSTPVPPAYRCQKCRSKETRMKMVGLVARRGGPITGFECRARCCGAINRFEVSPTESQAAA